MSDRDVIIRELEQGGWIVVADGNGYVAGHPDARDCTWHGEPAMNTVNQAGATDWTLTCPVYCLGRVDPPRSPGEH